ncbi:anthrone oxygenase family protein [Sinomonas sp. G460-2]|uniref:anthrone oxygenase family protein n=1 Tax=Sinomonas sp. G460-2 TaxID=3393464 RepID=UPI0039EEE58A
MISVLSVITATVVGLMVGVEFAVAFVVNPIVLRLPVGASLEARAHGGRMLGRAMPFWYIGSLILVAALTALAWGTPSAAASLVAAALLAVSIIMSVALLVPINNRSVTWTAEDHPADWREQHQRWDRLHYARVAILVAALVLVLVAVAR